MRPWRAENQQTGREDEKVQRCAEIKVPAGEEVKVRVPRSPTKGRSSDAPRARPGGVERMEAEDPAETHGEGPKPGGAKGRRSRAGMSQVGFSGAGEARAGPTGRGGVVSQGRGS